MHTGSRNTRAYPRLLGPSLARERDQWLVDEDILPPEAVLTRPASDHTGWYLGSKTRKPARRVIGRRLSWGSGLRGKV